MTIFIIALIVAVIVVAGIIVLRKRKRPVPHIQPTSGNFDKPVANANRTTLNFSTPRSSTKPAPVQNTPVPDNTALNAAIFTTYINDEPTHKTHHDSSSSYTHHTPSYHHDSGGSSHSSYDHGSSSSYDSSSSSSYDSGSSSSFDSGGGSY